LIGILNNLGFDAHQFNDDSLWNNRNQTSENNYGGYPDPTPQQIADINRNKTIDY
jgi:hypothetical protein